MSNIVSLASRHVKNHSIACHFRHIVIPFLVRTLKQIFRASTAPTRNDIQWVHPTPVSIMVISESASISGIVVWFYNPTWLLQYRWNRERQAGLTILEYRVFSYQLLVETTLTSWYHVSVKFRTSSRTVSGTWKRRIEIKCIESICSIRTNTEMSERIQVT